MNRTDDIRKERAESHRAHAGASCPACDALNETGAGGRLCPSCDADLRRTGTPILVTCRACRGKSVVSFGEPHCPQCGHGLSWEVNNNIDKDELDRINRAHGMDLHSLLSAMW